MKRDRANKQDRGRHRSAWRKTGKRNRTEKDIGAHEKRHGKQTNIPDRKIHESAWRETGQSHRDKHKCMERERQCMERRGKQTGQIMEKT